MNLQWASESTLHKRHYTQILQNEAAFYLLGIDWDLQSARFPR